MNRNNNNNMNNDDNSNSPPFEEFSSSFTNVGASLSSDVSSSSNTQAACDAAEEAYAGVFSVGQQQSQQYDGGFSQFMMGLNASGSSSRALLPSIEYGQFRDLVFQLSDVARSEMRQLVESINRCNTDLVMGLRGALDRCVEEIRLLNNTPAPRSQRVDLGEDRSIENARTAIQRLYGSSESRRELMANVNRHGLRDETVEGKGKVAVLRMMDGYYEALYKKVPAAEKSNYPKAVYIPSSDELEHRYAETYSAIYDFVAVQVLPSCPGMRKWTDITSRDMKKLYSVMAEDYVEKLLGHKTGPQHLNAEDKTSGLPLFASNKHSAVNYFLGATIASLTRGKKVKYGSVPAIGGIGTSNQNFANLLDFRSGNITLVGSADEDQVSIEEGDDDEGGDDGPSSSAQMTPAQRILRAAGGSAAGSSASAKRKGKAPERPARKSSRK